MKSNAEFKRAHNLWLGELEAYRIGAAIGSEPFWSSRLGVSRTLVRASLKTMAANGIVGIDGRRKQLLRRPGPQDFFPQEETESVGAIVEKRFMRWLLDGDSKPGQQINGLDLARQFGVSAFAVRDYLERFSRFGLIERRRNSSWIFKGFTAEFAAELFEVREMFELRSAQRFLNLAPEAPAWAALERIEREHRQLLSEMDARYHDFSELDERFHRLINDASLNRFVVGFYDVISMVFHYHYQWNKNDEKQRNVNAIGEHLDYIAALRARDAPRALSCCRAHMATARATLLDSIRPD